MSAELFVVHGRQDRSEAEPFEVGTVQWIRRPGEGGRDVLSSGFWFVDPQQAPEPMEVVGHADESVLILEGRVRIQPAGDEAAELTAGDSASFNRGVPVTWTVLEPTVEFFVYS